MVNIKGLDKAQVLKALYDHSHAQGSGFLQAVPDGVVTVEHCAMLLGSQTYFDYLYGRVMKVELSGDEFNERLYDRDCGEGAAQRAVDSIRAEKEGNKDTAGNVDGEKNEPPMDERAKLAKEAVDKCREILKELPPDAFFAACMVLKMSLPGPEILGGLAGMLTRGGMFTPSMLFKSTEAPMGWPSGMGPRGRFG